MNHYEVLGVEPGSEGSVIKRAYLDAARRYHPDYHADADEAARREVADRMQAVNEAWQVLGDPASRAAYDRAMALSTDPGVARRAAREPGGPAVPAGKGWTPRAGDDGWMEDFDAWASERDEPPPDVPRSASRGVVTVLPVGLFVAAIVSVFVGVAVGARALLALGVALVIVSAGLFVLLPMFEMARSNRRP
ncbi:MAG: DnaJ domain-containing protein [Acidimicrobiales bacterium]|nr:DnaJ domain-containing protein [Acidimicrobiales bacterium]